MDFIMDYRLIYCLNNGLPLENGNRPVEVPDFTRGGWNVAKGN